MDRNPLYKKMHALLRELGIADSKEDILAGYGVESSKELSDSDLVHLVARLDEMKRGKVSVTDEVRNHRSSILAQLQKMNIYSTNNDWTKVNAFLLQPRIAGKVLYEMNAEELRTLKMKLHAIFEKWKNEQNKERLFAQLN